MPAVATSAGSCLLPWQLPPIHTFSVWDQEGAHRILKCQEEESEDGQQERWYALKPEHLQSMISVPIKASLGIDG